MSITPQNLMMIKRICLAATTFWECAARAVVVNPGKQLQHLDLGAVKPAALLFHPRNTANNGID